MAVAPDQFHQPTCCVPTLRIIGQQVELQGQGVGSRRIAAQPARRCNELPRERGGCPIGNGLGFGRTVDVTQHHRGAGEESSRQHVGTYNPVSAIRGHGRVT